MEGEGVLPALGQRQRLAVAPKASGPPPFFPPNFLGGIRRAPLGAPFTQLDRVQIGLANADDGAREVADQGDEGRQRGEVDDRPDPVVARAPVVEVGDKLEVASEALLWAGHEAARPEIGLAVGALDLHGATFGEYLVDRLLVALRLGDLGGALLFVPTLEVQAASGVPRQTRTALFRRLVAGAVGAWLASDLLDRLDEGAAGHRFHEVDNNRLRYRTCGSCRRAS